MQGYCGMLASRAQVTPTSMHVRQIVEGGLQLPQECILYKMLDADISTSSTVAASASTFTLPTSASISTPIASPSPPRPSAESQFVDQDNMDIDKKG
jgi:hypothetical protein